MIPQRTVMVADIVEEYGHFDECGRAGRPDHDAFDPVCAERMRALHADMLALFAALPASPDPLQHFIVKQLAADWWTAELMVQATSREGLAEKIATLAISGERKK